MPAKLDRCVMDLMARGYEKSAAFAICSGSTGFVKKKGGGWKQTKPKTKKSKK